jgi:hypothetical protein
MQGILGGQAQMGGRQGTSAGLTWNVNIRHLPLISPHRQLTNLTLPNQKMASNFTNQVHSISEVMKAMALGGDLPKLVNVDVRGEMLDLKMTNRKLRGGVAGDAREQGHACDLGSHDRGDFDSAGVCTGGARDVEGVRFRHPGVFCFLADVSLYVRCQRAA